MRRLILSDIHGNLEALQAVLAHAAGRYDEVVCCGDLVGYGANPNEIVDWARENIKTIVRGNHDRVCCGLEEPQDFNAAAEQAVHIVREMLTPESREYLAALPRGPVCSAEYEVAHGSPSDEDEYLLSLWDVMPFGDQLLRPICFIGHTHTQGGWLWMRGSARKLNVQPGSTIDLHPDAQYLINPGAVGQPRDGDPRAAYALWDAEHRSLQFLRVAYDVAGAQARIRAAGLAERLAERLAVGR